MDINRESSTKMSKCLVCGQIFTNVKTCVKHLISMHPEFSFDDENFNPDSESIMFEKISADQILTCEYCDSLFVEKLALHQHENNHDINIGYQCANCEVVSRDVKFILNHRLNDCPHKKYESSDTNVTVYFVCSICDSTFESLTQLYKHRYATKHFQTMFNQKTREKEYFCEKCSEILSSLDHLLDHADIFHSRKAKAKPTVASYLCEICGKVYKQSSHLYQHLRFHKGIKPFECSFENCNRRFTIRPDLNDHIRKCHTGERKYKCTDCTKTFLTGSVYYQHRLIHRKERRYGCDTCDKRFYRSDALKNHERIHTGEKPYPCSGCSKKFRQKGDRDKHFRNRHQNSLIGLNTTEDEVITDEINKTNLHEIEEFIADETDKTNLHAMLQIKQE